MSPAPQPLARRPMLWLPIVLAFLTLLGGQLLCRSACVQPSDRNRAAYGAQLAWPVHFDALSAACGAGLLTLDLDDEYTPRGRWVLVLLGVAGAVAYLVAGRQVIGRLWADSERRLPSATLIVCTYLGLQVVLVPVVWVVGRGVSLEDAAWQAVAAFSSLGWRRGPDGLGWSTICAAISVLAALGWPIWLAMRRFNVARTLIIGAGTYMALLLLGATLVATLETPRGTTPPQATDERLAAQTPSLRFTRGLVQVTAAAGAGLPTEQLGERGVSEGTKVTLAGAVLLGGLGGTAGGGVTWLLALCAITGIARRAGTAPGDTGDTRRWAWAGITCGVTLVTLAVAVALGLLLIEARTAPSYQAQPTFADALLDAASAVGGANLSSGLTAAVIGPNLSSGIRQSVDQYYYGMTWLMLAMLGGRILPVLVLWRAAGGRRGVPANKEHP